MMCASCGKSEVDDKAQEELKKRDDACEDYSNEIVIENDTQFAAASPPPPQEDHDIVVEAFAVPEEDIVVTAAEQGENQNNGEQQQDDEEAVVQHPPQHSDQSPSSPSDNVPATQRVRKMLSIVGDFFERSLNFLPLYFFCNLVVLMIMMVIGAATQSSTITYILPIYAGIAFGLIFVVMIIVICRKKWQERVRPIFNDGSRFKQIMFMGGVITSVVGIIMIIVGGVSKNQTIVYIGAYLLVAILFSFFILKWWRFL